MLYSVGTCLQATTAGHLAVGQPPPRNASAHVGWLFVCCCADPGAGGELQQGQHSVNADNSSSDGGTSINANASNDDTARPSSDSSGSSDAAAAATAAVNIRDIGYRGSAGASSCDTRQARVLRRRELDSRRRAVAADSPDPAGGGGGSGATACHSAGHASVDTIQARARRSREIKNGKADMIVRKRRRG
jgi:hypothetical protein